MAKLRSTRKIFRNKKRRTKRRTKRGGRKQKSLKQRRTKSTRKQKRLRFKRRQRGGEGEPGDVVFEDNMMKKMKYRQNFELREFRLLKNLKKKSGNKYLGDVDPELDDKLLLMNITEDTHGRTYLRNTLTFDRNKVTFNDSTFEITIIGDQRDKGTTKPEETWTFKPAVEGDEARTQYERWKSFIRPHEMSDMAEAEESAGASAGASAESAESASAAPVDQPAPVGQPAAAASMRANARKAYAARVRG